MFGDDLGLWDSAGFEGLKFTELCRLIFFCEVVV